MKPLYAPLRIDQRRQKKKGTHSGLHCAYFCKTKMHSSTDMQNNNTWIKKTGKSYQARNQQTEQSQRENCNDQNHIPYRNRFKVLEVENHECDDMFEDEIKEHNKHKKAADSAKKNNNTTVIMGDSMTRGLRQHNISRSA